MADNVAITAGAGTSVATDDVAGVHYQKMKLYTSEADSAEGVGDDDKGASRALWVTVRANTLAPAVIDSSGLTIAATAYSANDVLGAGWEVTNAARAAGGTGKVRGVALVDVADIIGATQLHFFTGSVTFGTDNAAPSISDADAAKWIGSVAVAPIDLGGVRVAGQESMAMMYTCDATSLYVYAVTLSGHTFFGAATDLKLRILLELD